MSESGANITNESGIAESISTQEVIKQANVVADAIKLDSSQIEGVDLEDIKDIYTFADSLSRVINKREDPFKKDPSPFAFPIVFKDSVHEYLLGKLRKEPIEAAAPVIVPKNDQEVAQILFEESNIPGYYVQTTMFKNEQRIPNTALVSTPPEVTLQRRR